MKDCILNLSDIEQIEVCSLYKAIQLLENQLPQNQEVINLLRIVFTSILDKEFNNYKRLAKPFYSFDNKIIYELSIAYRDKRLPFLTDTDYIEALKEAILNIMLKNTPVYHACVEALKGYYVKIERAEEFSESEIKTFKKYIHELYTKKRSTLNDTYALNERNKTVTLRYQGKEYTWTYCEFGHRLYFDTWYIKKLREGITPNMNREIPQILSNKDAIHYAEQYLERIENRKKQSDQTKLPF